MSYEPKTYRKDGGDTFVIASGGKLMVESGGSIVVDGDTYVVTEPDDVSLEVDEVSGELQIKSQDAIADLELTASVEYVGSELTAVAAKLDAVLAALRLAKVIAED